jgi:beta-phosphoglucomutase-like phosphatase (HAD superfamily)
VPPFDAVIFDLGGVVTGTRVFAGTVELVRRLRAGGVPVGLATASRDAQPLLGSARLQELFDVVVDGTVAKTMGLPGKPDPALLLEVLRRLGVPSRRAAVVEDAAVGVQAGRRAGRQRSPHRYAWLSAHPRCSPMDGQQPPFGEG